MKLFPPLFSFVVEFSAVCVRMLVIIDLLASMFKGQSITF